jgi:hypothetical protein
MITQQEDILARNILLGSMREQHGVNPFDHYLLPV